MVKLLIVSVVQIDHFHMEHVIICLPSQLLSFIYIYMSTAAAIGRKLWLRFVGNFSWRGTKKGHAIVKIVIVVHTVCYGSVHRRCQLPAINKR